LSLRKTAKRREKLETFKSRVAFVLAALLVLAGTVLAQEDAGDQAYQQALVNYRAAATPQEKLDALLDFINAYPNHHVITAGVLRLAVDHYCKDLNDPQAAIALVRDVLDKTSENGKRLQVQSILIDLYGQTGDDEALRTAVADLSLAGDPDFSIRWTIVQSCVNAGAWDLAADQADAALALTTPEAVRAESLKAGYEPDERVVVRTASQRAGDVLAAKGWALAHLDREDEAQDLFRQAESRVQFFYVGVPNSDLNIYRAKLLLKNGDYAGAIEQLAGDAIMVGKEEALQLLRQAYVASRTSEAGFEDFFWEKRLEIAREVDDFTLPDYGGNLRTLSDLRGKVTILTFWFPT
jgi:tetratricopeptide (TPR) repeat protein